jgi:gliding motility-associated-like protein
MKKVFTPVFLFVAVLMHYTSSAQYIATWALTSNKTAAVTGAQAASVTAGSMVPGGDFPNPGSHNTDGYQAIQTLGDWPTAPTDGLHLDFPLSPVGSVDVTITSVTATSRTSGGSGSNLLSLAYQADGAGPWVAFGTPQTAASGGTSNQNFTGLTTKFYSGHTYLIRMYVYAAGSGVTTSRNVRIKSVVVNGTVISPAGTQPTVATNNVSAITKYTATATGTLTAGTLAITTSGVVWGTAVNPDISLATKTTNGPVASGTITGNITGLTAGTTYHVRAYATSEAGNTIYGVDLTFTTLPPTIPALTTNAVTNILSIKATSGGVITDSGGTAITQKGVVWGSAANPTVPSANSTSDGTTAASFSSLMTGLTPSTTYHVRSYAINSIGTGYGNDIAFTTAPPTPIITAVPTSLSFGSIAPGTVAQKTYVLSGNVLTPAAGNITVTAPAGYQVSLSSGGGFANSITVPYTGGALPNTTIYVRFSPVLYGAYNGTITHAGGGATGAYVDNVAVTGIGAQPASDVSNMGTDFWVGYGYQALMTGNNGQDMVLYLSSKQDAVVTVEIPGIGYTQTYNVVANVALATATLPKTTGSDARLISTGILQRGIHVYSNGVPIAVWAHIYAGSSSGATMVLPTNTWGTDYTALTTGGQTNSGIPHSFFFVQAAEDNTVVDINPSADITAAASGTTILYPANVPFAVTLNKGDVFNALGKLISSQNGVDLTGTTVKARDCKKIALFTGNGRVQLSVGGCSYSNGGSDNLIQQMFPKVAWGTKYLTSPFRDMEAGLIRIAVSDPTTQVKVNGAVLPLASLNQFYYQVETDTTTLIETTKPVMVAQFCASNACNGTGIATHPSTGANGDPEMVILSPVTQAVNDVTVYSALNYSIQHNYINVIVKNDGVASFTFDGVNAASAFKVHPNDAGYSYAVFAELQGGVSHRLTSVSTFNAIAYGFSTNSNNESYGYNAGTNVKDLNTSLNVTNPYPNTSTTTGAVTCLGNPITYSVTLPYKALSLTWDFNNNPNQSPNTTVVQNAPVASDSVLKDGTWLYIFKITTPYTFSAVGTYTVTITANNPTPDGCTGLRTINLSVLVVDKPKADFTTASNGCPTDVVTFTDATNGFGRAITQWNWNFGDAGTATVKNPTHAYAAAGNYNVTLRSISDIGCYHDTVKVYTVQPLPTASFTAATEGCVNTAVTFTSTSTTSLGVLNSFTWNYGDAATETVTTNTPRTHSYTNPGPYTVTLVVKNDKGCTSTIFSKPITIYRTTADFTFTTTACANTPVQFTDASNGGTAPITITNWLWNFGTGTSTVQNPPFTFTTAGTFNVSLQATSSKGCVGNVTKSVTILSPLAAPVITTGTINATSIQFQWTAITGAVGYQVSTDNGVTFTAPSSGATGLTHTVTGLTPNQTVTIIVRVVGTNTCQNNTGTATAKTLLPDVGIFVANTFTPNGDGRNDLLMVRSNYIQSLNMKVFNQWGEMIFETTDMTKGWDGTAKGKAQPVGVYVYVLNAVMTDGRNINKKGSINLIR